MRAVEATGTIDRQGHLLLDHPFVESPTNVLLLTIYSKSDRDDISSAEILNILSVVFKP